MWPVTECPFPSCFGLLVQPGVEGSAGWLLHFAGRGRCTLRHGEKWVGCAKTAVLRDFPGSWM